MPPQRKEPHHKAINNSYHQHTQEAQRNFLRIKDAENTGSCACTRVPRQLCAAWGSWEGWRRGSEEERGTHFLYREQWEPRVCYSALELGTSQTKLGTSVAEMGARECL